MSADNARSRLKALILRDPGIPDAEIAAMLSSEGRALRDFVIAAVATDFRHTLRTLRNAGWLAPDFVIRQPRDGSTACENSGQECPTLGAPDRDAADFRSAADRFANT
jgi:hypothetical protein